MHSPPSIFSTLLFQFLTPETCSRILFLYEATSFSMSLRTACSWMFFCCKVASSSSSSANFLFVAFVASSTSKVFTSSTFTSLTRKLVVASSTSLGKAKLAICVSSIIHLSRSSASLDSTLPLLLLPLLLLLLATLTGSSILPSASNAGKQSPRLASSKLTPAQTVSVLLLLLITSTICSTSVFCSVMCRVVVGKGS